MKKLRLLGIIITFGFGSSVWAQTNTCSGSYTSTTAGCQTFTVGDGTTGFIKICLDVNNIPSGGGTSCNPGGACNPPFNGGGWAARFAVYDSGGNLIDQFTGATAAGDCIYVPVSDGIATIYGLCLTAGTVISWETVDACGNNICSGPVTCNPPGSCDCANPCGPACGWATAPTVNQVTSNCTEYPYLPELGPSTSSSSCYTFVATSNSVDFGVIVSSNCGGGNVTGFGWEVYTSGSCGTAVQSGTLASLTMSPMIIGQQYTFCYSFTTPACTHTSHYPYFVGASQLPVVFKDFKGFATDKHIDLVWDIESEEGNHNYLIEKSQDGTDYEFLTIQQGNGGLNGKTYTFVDENPNLGMNYYKLTQIDEYGGARVLKTINVNFKDDNFVAEQINIYNLSGLLVQTVNVKDKNVQTQLRNMEFQTGFYIIEMVDALGNKESFKYFKQNDF